MAGELIQCDVCKRHVFAGETACPFCQASLGGGGRGFSAAMALSAGLAVAGCSQPPVAVYGGPPPPVTASATATTASATAPEPPPPAPAYGVPPPPVAASATTGPKPPVAAPAYGGPPPRKLR